MPEMFECRLDIDDKGQMMLSPGSGGIEGIAPSVRHIAPL
jgi:hypothetical protein